MNLDAIKLISIVALGFNSLITPEQFLVTMYIMTQCLIHTLKAYLPTDVALLTCTFASL